MSFFGLENSNDLEHERRKFLEGGQNARENVAEYTWGEESYDGLGDALQEGGDELNDETFGGPGEVGKDFDFTAQSLPGGEQPARLHEDTLLQSDSVNDFLPRRKPAVQSDFSPLPSRSVPHRPRAEPSLESLWDNPSSFPVQPRTKSQTPGLVRHATGGSGRATFSPFAEEDPFHTPPPAMARHGNSSIRTLEEVEAEMLGSRPHAVRSPSMLELERQQAEEYQRQLLRQEQEREILQHQLLVQQQQQQHEQRDRDRRILEHQRRIQLAEQEEVAFRAREREHERLLYLQQQRLQQEAQLQQRGTPPPRMMHPGVSQSPRFMEHQRQALLLQQRPDAHQRLLLEEQLRQEELERQWREQQAAQLELLPRHEPHRRQPSNQDLQHLLHLQALQQQQQQQQQLLAARQRSQSPALRDGRYQDSYLAELERHQFPGDMHPDYIRELDPAEREMLLQKTNYKIHETERMAEKNRRKASKIAHMARYNDLMTQSDKDFITRIQVSQLVSQDPFADDYYAQMFSAIQRSKQGLDLVDDRVLKFGSGGGLALGTPQKGMNRRPNAMQRMEQQVERIVNNARKREEEKGQHALSSLQGALGKTSGRSYKAAPRQLLQVDSVATDSQKEDGAAANDTVPIVEPEEQSISSSVAHREPLSRRQILISLEHLYDLDLRLSNLAREEPSQEDLDTFEFWHNEFEELIEQIWRAFKMDEGLESGTHPLVSFLSVAKGKRLIFRLAKNYFSQHRQLQVAMLLVASFDQLDIVRDAPVLDSLQDSTEREEVQRQTNTFVDNFSSFMLHLIPKFELKMLSGYFGEFLKRNNVVQVLRSQAGLALATMFFTQGDNIRHAIQEGSAQPSPEDWQTWQARFDQFLQTVLPALVTFFPSERLQSADPVDESIDILAWNFMATMATLADDSQRWNLVSILRDKILKNIAGSKEAWIEEEQRLKKIENVNRFLNAVGLDSSQIPL